MNAHDLKAVKAGARVEAEWDGRDFEALGRADKARYIDRFDAAVRAYLASVSPALPEDAARLVERLKTYRPCDEWGQPIHHTICDEAAAALTALAKERDEVRHNAQIVCDSYADENQRLFDRAQAAEAEIASLKARLEEAGANLEGRDQFIVSKGLWSDYIATLPSAVGDLEAH